jgi:hypothetical protein
MALLLGLSRLTPLPLETNDFRRNPLEARRGRCANAHFSGAQPIFSGSEVAFVVAAVSRLIPQDEGEFRWSALHRTMLKNMTMAPIETTASIKSNASLRTGPD